MIKIQQKLEINSKIYTEVTNQQCDKEVLEINSDFVLCGDVALMSSYQFASLCKKWAYTQRGYEITSTFTHDKYYSFLFDQHLIVEFEPQEFSSDVNEVLSIIQCVEFILKGDCVN